MANSLKLTEAKFTEVLNIVRQRITLGRVDPIVILGKAGVGKTEQIAQIAKERNIGYKEIRLLIYDPAELKGIPYADKENKLTEVFPSDLLPQADRDGERGILVLDEVTSCSSQARTAVYQLLDAKRSLGHYHLPDGWLVVCLGNGPEDGGNYQGSEGAFFTRCQCYHVEVDPKGWCSWARTHGVNPSVIAFIDQNPTMLHTYSQELADETDGECIFATPRSWTMASRELTDMENNNYWGAKPENIQDEVQIHIGGYVGDDCATRFAAMYKLKEQMVSINDILDGKNPPVKSTDQAIIYLTAEQLGMAFAQRLKDHKKIEQMTTEDVNLIVNVFDWIDDLNNNNGRIVHNNDFKYTVLSSLVQRCQLMGELWNRMASVGEENYDKALRRVRGVSPETLRKLVKAISMMNQFAQNDSVQSTANYQE